MTTAVVPWAALDADGKRARVLAVADDLFAREGLDVSMPTLAAAVGAGVGSLYRQVGRKEDIVAALVAQRVAAVARLFEDAAGSEDPWAALGAVTLEVVGSAMGDHLTREAWATSSEHPDVRAVRPRAAAGLERLVAAARATGALRADAGADDLRLVFRAAKDVEALGPGGARRLAELVLRGMADPGAAD